MGRSDIAVLLAAGVLSCAACRSGSGSGSNGTSSSTEAGPATSATAELPTLPDDGTVKIEELAPGDGPTAMMGDTAKVLYVGKLLDGREFDSSQKHGGTPYAFVLGGGRAIKGYDFGVAGMKVHGKRRFTVPPSLAYGPRGVPGIIPPNATLVFEVELVDITSEAGARN